ncbi:MAG TPA: hypothetical protein VJA21_17545 [Verrucomicrobiae bacterium]
MIRVLNIFDVTWRRRWSSKRFPMGSAFTSNTGVAEYFRWAYGVDGSHRDFPVQSYPADVAYGIFCSQFTNAGRAER